MYGKFAGKLSDGSELKLQVGEAEMDRLEEEVGEAVDWMMDNGYASDIEESVIAGFPGSDYSPRFKALAITPAQEYADNVEEYLRDELDVLSEDTDVVTHPKQSEFRTVREVLESVEKNGLRLHVEAFAEDEDMPWKVRQKIPFGGNIENRNTVESKLERLDKCLNELEQEEDIEVGGYKHHYFPGLRGEPTLERAVQDIENGLSIHTEVKDEDEFYMKVGYLRPNIPEEGTHGGAAIEEPFFGYSASPTSADEEYTRQGHHIAKRIHEKFDSFV
ncbi:MAG: hypothetical protein ABEJ72_03030 [Candidatus Aenigmatarchaeota archaeon]